MGTDGENIWRAGRRHWDARRPADAVAAFRRAVAADPRYAAAQFDLAATLLARGDLEEACRSFTRAARLVRTAEAYARAGMVRLALGRHAEARAPLRAAAALGPGDGEVLFHLAACDYNAGAHAEAVPLFARAAALLPENAEVLYRWGMALFRCGRYAEAEQPLARACALRPGWGDAHYHLGLALMRRSSGSPAATLRSPLHLTGDRVVVTLTGRGDAPGLLAFHIRNRPHIDPWHPGTAEERLSLRGWQDWTEAAEGLFAAGQAVRMVVRLRERADLPDIVGEINGRVEQGVLQSCTIGYHIDAAHEGRGLMREALGLVLDYLFRDFGVRRVLAYHDPDNRRSAALLRRMGFREVGRLESYLRVGTVWRDQILVDLPSWAWPRG